MTLTAAIASLAGALLVGLLIGAQREAAGRAHPGLRDFLLIALVAGLCGMLGSPALGAAALVGISATLAVFHWEERAERTGITTELAALGTFLLAYLAASGAISFGRPLAIGLTIVVVIFLEARERIQTFARSTITQAEFNATLAFVAIVLVIYPVLPTGSYGPFAFFSPRQVWMFVILISSISYVGYFLEKFLGEERGMFYTSVLGGLASTTAATLHFAHESRERPELTFGLWRAFVLSNTVQFPRTLLIVAAVSPALTLRSAWPLMAMMLAGVAFSEILGRWPHKAVAKMEIKADNPFRIGPALKFGALFTAVVFISKAAAARLGMQAFLGTSLLGGLVDVATVIAPAADLLKQSRISMNEAEGAVMLGLVSNAALKTALAASAGTVGFAMRVGLTFVGWAAVGGAAWWIALKIAGA